MRSTGIVIGYHGCWRDVAENLVNGRTPLIAGTNPWDWLGTGIYFWEGSLERALEWEPYYSKSGRSKSDWCAVGAVIALGNCLDLLDQECVGMVRNAYDLLIETYSGANMALPQNESAGPHDKLRRKRLLDFKVLNYVHDIREMRKLQPFDTVRGAFPEGDAIYPGAELYDQTHIQLCVRNPANILGYFVPPGVQF